MRSLIPIYAFLQSNYWLREFLPLFALWAIIGDCGTPYPGWWPHPKPEPDPWWRPRLIGVVAGIVGGWIFTQVFTDPQPHPWTSALPVAASAVGAFAASRLVGDLYQFARGAGQAQG
jgi:hypothetical protein